MKRILITIFSLLTVTLVSGQVIQSFGIKSGLSIANQTWYYKSLNLTLKKHYRQGFYSVVTLDFLQSKYFNITTDIGYCQKGNREKIANTTVNMPEGDGTYKNYDTKFNYFTFSPLLKVKYQTTHWTPYALMGFRLDYQLSYQSDFYLQAIDSNFHKTIFGLSSGAGLEYKIKNVGINTEFQYHYDLTKLMDTPSSATNAGLAINNKTFIINIGLKYYLQRTEDKK